MEVVAGVVRLRIDLAYDGLAFHGFARQPDHPTVQGALEDALGLLLDQRIRTVGAGRTDRGVHAMGQVVHLDVRPGRERPDRFLTAPVELRDRLQRMLGDPITVWAVTTVPAEFDARFSATERRYRYHLVDGDAIDPRDRNRVWHVREPLRIGAMRTAARSLLGEHDFSSFCRRRGGQRLIRRIDAITVSRRGDGGIDVRLRAPAFCHQQVRSIVGSLVLVGRGARPAGWMETVLTARDRSAAGPVAPPQGLTLESVRYGRRYPASPPGVG